MPYMTIIPVVLAALVAVFLFVPAASRVTLSATVVSQKPLEEVFAYMANFENATEWDPASVEMERVSGDGTLGTQYRNVTEFNGNKTTVMYSVTDYRVNDRVEIRGENNTLSAIDTMVFRRTSAGTQVTYTAEFTFKGIYRIASPFLRPAFNKLEEGAERGLREKLG